ncbi:MAG: hypothetical protein IIB44_12290 [Candidatus Marinimicrobia bacterium]|nr:hypothetical protein [Candidatus Neomarinimicrobiota bacterium]
MFRTRSLFALISLQSIVLGGNVQISTSLVYPRIDIQTEDQIVSRARFVFNNDLGKIGDVRLDFEYGSPAISQRDRLRIYVLRFRMKVGFNHRVEAGRLTEWNPLYIARVDGVRASLKLKSLGTVTYLGGVISSNDFSSESYSIDNNAHYLEWKTNIRSNRYSLNGWILNDGESSKLFSGVSFYQKLPLRIKLTGYLSWDFHRAETQKVRVRFFRTFRVSHTLFAEYRYRSLSVLKPYPWVRKNITTRPAVSFGVTSRISPTILWTNTFLTRVTDREAGTYFKSKIQWSMISVSFVTENQNLAESTGGTFSVTHDFSNSLSAGGSISYRAYTFNNNYDTLDASGLYGWVNFQPNSHIKIKFTGQFYRNRFFNQDGRAGLSLSYAI